MPAAPTYLDFAALARWADTPRASYANADPLAHVVHTSFLAAEAVAAAIREFPTPDQIHSFRNNEASESEAGCRFKAS